MPRPSALEAPMHTPTRIVWTAIFQRPVGQGLERRGVEIVAGHGIPAHVVQSWAWGKLWEETKQGKAEGWALETLFGGRYVSEPTRKALSLAVTPTQQSPATPKGE